MEMLILTFGQAQDVRGPTAEGAALDPSPLADGTTFVLPLAVLDDPAHASRRTALAAFPRREVAPQEWPEPILP